MARLPRTFPALVALLAFGLVAPSAVAADKWPVPSGASHEPAPFQYDAKLWKGVPKDFLDDAAACVLQASTSYLVEADGTVETVTREVTRMNGRKAVEKLGEYKNITYDPAYQTLTLNTTVIHKADGHDAPIEPRDVQLRDISTDYQVYDHEKQLIISFPSLEVGDVIDVEWTVRGKNPEHNGQFFTRYTFGDAAYPVVADEMRVRLPKDMTFKYAPFGGKIEPDQVEEKDKGTVLYHWKAVNVPKPPLDENLPSKEELRMGVACSTFPSWEAVGKWKQKLREECWAATADVRQVTTDAAKGLTDPVAKARALTYWMRRNIRYVSAGEAHDYTPHLPAEILTNRYGDCKDTSQLLAVMLREAGIKVELATLGARDDGQIIESVPSPWGTHAILVATIDDKEHWIDTTSSLAGWDFLPHDDHDRVCYVVDDKGKIRLTRTPALTAAENRMDQTTEVWIGADGSTRNERVAVSHGSAAIVQRDDFLETPSGERRRQVAAELQDANSRAHLTKLSVDEAALRDFDQPVTARINFDIDKHFALSNGGPEREGSIADSKTWGKFLAFNLDYDREAAMQFYSPFESHHRYVVHLPPAFTLDGLPNDKDLHSDWGSFVLKVKELDGGAGRDLELDFTMKLEKARIEPADFDKFRQFHEDVSRAYRVWLTLKPAADLADAPALEALLGWAPEDAASAATLAHIYEKHGQGAEARRVLRRALHYHPDDKDMLGLAVECAEKPEDEIAAQRELVKRFPDDLQHAVELGAVLVKHSKHDQARAVLEPLTKKGPPPIRAGAHYQLARSCYRKDELENALKHLSDAEAADEESVNTVRAHQLKGLVLEELKRPAEAAVSYSLALALDHEAAEPLLGLIRVSLDDNKPAEALTYLRRYIAVVGDDFDGQLEAADYSLRLERWDDAFDLAGRARDQKFHEKAYRILGLVYLHRGDYARAAEHLDKADANEQVLEGMIKAQLALGNLREVGFRVDQAGRLDKPGQPLRDLCDKGRRLLQRRAELEKQTPAPADKKGEWAEALDRLVCAEDALEEDRPAADVEAMLAPAFASGVEVGPAYALRGRLAMGRGKLTAALSDAEKAVKLSPRDAGGYYVRGKVRLERGDLPNGLADLEKAAELTRRQNADVLHGLADALYRSGKLDDALKAQRIAVKLKPKDKEMADQLGVLEQAAKRDGK
jgi:tetratricopeptide (TPR) repeat protein